MVLLIYKHMKQIGYLVLGIFIMFTSCTTTKNEKVKENDVLVFVDPFIGTGFHGHTFPGVVVPHGRVQISPDTHLLGWEACSGYHYEDTTLYGFSHTHLSGTGIGDLGDILFLPFTGDVSDAKPVAILSHDKEIAEPGYYSINVNPWDIKAEFSATERTAWHKYSFPAKEKAQLMIDLEHILQPNWGHTLLESQLTVVDEYTVVGYRLTKGWALNDPIWFKCVFDQPIAEYQLIKDDKNVEGNQAQGVGVTAYLKFSNQVLNSKVAISSVDQDGAASNMSELKNHDSLESVVAAAQKQWKQELSKIEIETKDKDVLTNFYTALYHSKIAPMVWGDVDGRYRGQDGEIYTSLKNDRYTVYSLWDVFRSWYPLMTIIEPERARAWAYDLVDQGEKGGLLPKWSLNANYTGTMVGYPAVSIIADAYAKGLMDSIPQRVLDIAIKSSRWNAEFNKKHKGTGAERVMSEHIKYKEEMGFVPRDKCNGSVSYGLEMAYYDWCIGVIADLVGDKNIAKMYMDKGKAYQEYFDPNVKFMRGKNSDGSWEKGFNPRYSDHKSSEYIEGNAWQWTPFVPHAIDDFAHLLGGKEELGVWLDSLFTTSSVIEGENASGDITGLIGQYAHGNEPSHHIPFMYQYSDRAWRAQEILDTVLYHFYEPTPAGIIGNEDCGQMSAWYVLNSLGIYQVAPGKAEFRVGRPLVDKAKLKVKDGWFTILVENNSPANKYVKQILLNNKELENGVFDYKDFKANAILKITMSPDK